jgi:TPR repeat protein
MYSLGFLSEREGNKEGAKEWYKKAAALDNADAKLLSQKEKNEPQESDDDIPAAAERRKR